MRDIWFGDPSFSDGPNPCLTTTLPGKAPRTLGAARGCLNNANLEMFTCSYSSVFGLKSWRISGFQKGLHRIPGRQGRWCLSGNVGEREGSRLPTLPSTSMLFINFTQQTFSWDLGTTTNKQKKPKWESPARATEEGVETGFQKSSQGSSTR